MKFSNKEKQEKVFKIVQDFLKNPPLIVWGSGATVPFGLPSMNELSEQLNQKISSFKPENENLEIELGKDKYKLEMPTIKKAIWEIINKADNEVLDKIITNGINEFSSIKHLIHKFIDPHPKILNIVTTNYDRTLEYIMSYHNIFFTDGFNGRVLSSFNTNLFKKNNIVNLIKVHGSLNWFEIDDDIRFLNSCSKENAPQIIAPSKSKYQEAYHRPYRELIQEADKVINEASSFLVIGFGFNDDHLTPMIKKQVKNGVPIVLITKKISKSTFLELEQASKFIFFEEKTQDLTNVVFKSNNSETETSLELEGNLWKLSNFMEILSNE